MLLLQPPFDFFPGEYRVKRVTSAWELAACRRLRQAVFCAEQGIFLADDGDAADARAISIAAVACMLGIADRVVGTVRIHQLEPGLWQGSRLAVEPDFRGVAWIGSELIRHAVGSARALGCARFIAKVQERNAPLFRRLHWRDLGETVLHGRAHRNMEADLAAYALRSAPEVALYPGLRAVA